MWLNKSTPSVNIAAKGVSSRTLPPHFVPLVHRSTSSELWKIQEKEKEEERRRRGRAVGIKKDKGGRKEEGEKGEADRKSKSEALSL